MNHILIIVIDDHSKIVNGCFLSTKFKIQHKININKKSATSHHQSSAVAAVGAFTSKVPFLPALVA